MKKTRGILWLALLLALLLALSLAPALAEETAPETDPALLGEWYAEMQNIALTLTLNENGHYNLSYPALPDAAQTGAWELRDGFVYLDGDEEEPLNYTGEKLILGTPRLIFSREPADVYLPGDIDPEAQLSDFAGAWRSAYALVGDAALPATAVGEDVRIFVENTRAAVTGTLLEDALLDFTFENGALTCQSGPAALTLALQTDHLLRLTLTAAGESVTLVCASYLTEGLFPEEEAAE